MKGDGAIGACIARPRLLDRLRASSRFAVTLIAAPAGFGKSVAMRQLLADTRERTVRFDLRAENGTLLGFVRGLVEAVAPIAPLAPTVLAGAYEQAAASPTTVADLGAWLSAHLREYRGVVALDDLHLARSDPSICALIAELVERTRGGIRWLIVTRETLTLPVASWLAYGVMGPPITEEDLRFAAGEARRLARAAGASPGRSEFRQLMKLTGGWATALAFAILASVRASNVESAVSQTRDLVYRYLAEQVLAGLTEPEREFLFATCVYPWLEVGLLERASIRQAAEIFDGLRRRGTFLQADSPVRFRYHDLFRDFVEHELRNRGRTACRDAQLRAAAALADAGFNDEAIGCYVRAGASDDVLRLLEQHGFELIRSGKADIAEAALSALTPAQGGEPIVLGMRGTLASRLGRYDEFEPLFERALALATAPLERMRMSYWFAVGFTNRHPGRVIALLEPYAGADSGPPDLLAGIAAHLATAYSAVGDPRAAPSISRALRLAASLGEGVRGMVRNQAGFVALAGGDVKSARQHAQTAMELAERIADFRNAAGANFVLGHIAYFFDDDPVAARASWRRAREFALRAGMRAFAASATADEYLLVCELGKDDELADLERTLEDIDARRFPAHCGSLSRAQALRAAWGGGFRRAYELVIDGIEHEHVAIWVAERWSAAALYAAAAGDRHAAEAALESANANLRQKHGAAGSAVLVPRALAFSALASLILGRSGSADALLRRMEHARSSAAPRPRAFLDAVRALLRGVRSGVRGTLPEASIRAVHEHGYGGYARLLGSLPLKGLEGGSRFGTLTKTELEVLGRLMRGHSGAIIAVETGRSPATIGLHVRSILKKLNCHSRLEAVALARSCGLDEELARSCEVLPTR